MKYKSTLVDRCDVSLHLFVKTIKSGWKVIRQSVSVVRGRTVVRSQLIKHLVPTLEKGKKDNVV